jgi:uncharacterized protein (TIGR02453 family)
MAFAGFPLAALDFYEDLEQDNSKAYWTAHRTTYDECVRAPMEALMAELSDEFGQRQQGQIFRPYRDIRFSKDKSPYKTHQGAFIALEDGMGYYVQISAEGLYVAGGYHAHAPDQVERFRAAVADDATGPAVIELVGQLTSAGWSIGGEALKTRPRGYPADHPRIELLRHKNLTASKGFGAPKWLSKPAARDQVAAAWRDLGPLNAWLGRHVGASRLPRDRR